MSEIIIKQQRLQHVSNSFCVKNVFVISFRIINLRLKTFQQFWLMQVACVSRQLLIHFLNYAMLNLAQFDAVPNSKFDANTKTVAGEM